MIREFHDVMVHPEFKDGVLKFSTYLSDAANEETAIAIATAGVEIEANVPEEVGFSCEFKAESLLRDMIELYRIQRYAEPTISADNKPMFDALRKELLEMVGQIDRLKVEA